MKKDMYDNRASLARKKGDIISESRRTAGDITGKFPVVFPQWRMVAYVSDPSKEKECREKWNRYHGVEF